MPKTIVMEFNELCPSFLRQWIDEGKLPNFGRLLERSVEFTTEPDVTDPGKLEPWIQWYSVHTGLAYDQHGVFHLTDGPRAGHEDIYSTFTAAGRTVGCFASMNVKPFGAPGSFFVGDPWTENDDAYPPELNVYNRFVSHNVREYSNSNGMGLADYGRFLSFMMLNGIRPDTVAAILRQLANEQLKDKRLSYQRVSILDRLQFDVFRTYWQRMKPELATFFANSTAHLQHSYWRHMSPEAFQIVPDANEMRIYGDAIEFGYRSMDLLVGEFMALAERHGARLVFMTALSQQPFLRQEGAGGQHFYRLKDVHRFLAQLGIEVDSVDPTMTNQYLARFANKASRDAAKAKLSSLSIGNYPLMGFAPIEAHEDELYFGCQVFTKTAPSTVVGGTAAEAEMQFGDAFYSIEAIKSGCHHPAGALWIQNGAHRACEAPVSILDIFPTLLDLHGIAPDHSSERRGRSLAPLLEDSLH